MQGRLTTAAAVREFMLAGNATLTLKSAKTESRFTYRIRKSDDGAVHFVGVMTGSDNESHFEYLGVIRGGLFSHGKKSRITECAESALAFRWFNAKLQCDPLPTALEVWHEGRCGRCGRKLTVPESIDSGFGPECVQKLVA